MNDKTNVEDIIGLVKTEEPTNSVDEVRKLRGRGETMSTINEQDIAEWKEKYTFNGRYWEQSIPLMDKDGNESLDWQVVPITVVPVIVLLQVYEDMIVELSDKEVELYSLKEAYLIAERKIIEETNFKELYGANNQKVRDQHVKAELQDLVDKKASLQFSIDFIRNYIPLLREVLRCKK